MRLFESVADNRIILINRVTLEIISENTLLFVLLSYIILKTKYLSGKKLRRKKTKMFVISTVNISSVKMFPLAIHKNFMLIKQC